MRASLRGLPSFVVPLLVVVAIVGFLAGRQRGAARTAQPPAVGAHVASGVNVLIEYPSGWDQVTTPVDVPALELGTRLLNLVPRSHPESAGLLSGVLQIAPSQPLPTRLLAAQPSTPRTEVVNLVSVQAFRYRHLIVPGYQGVVDLYVVPTPDYGATALACYASSGLDSELAQCEQIVASLTLVGQSTSVLTPDVEYARKLSGLLDALDSERSRLRLQLSHGTAAATVASAATSLAGRFSATSTALATVEPPAVVGPAQVRLARSLLAAGQAYRALAGAAKAASPSGYEAARTQVQAAESSVENALAGFSLLGYGHT